jgi:hypothetical protein
VGNCLAIAQQRKALLSRAICKPSNAPFNYDSTAPQSAPALVRNIGIGATHVRCLGVTVAGENTLSSATQSRAEWKSGECEHSGIQF